MDVLKKLRDVKLRPTKQTILLANLILDWKNKHFTAETIQKEVSTKAKEIQDNIIIEFRIGINLGDIMTQDNNLYGDNVNIAARLESIAPVGEITVSEKVYLEVEDKVDISFKYQGEKKLKNISKKIKVYTSQMTTDKKESVKFQKKPYIVI